MRVAELLERETDPRPLALMRIVVGLSAIAFAVFLERGVLQPLASEEIFRAPAFSWFPEPSRALVDTLLVLWIAFALALTVGLFARVAAVGVAVVAAATMALDLQAFSNHVTLLVVLCGLLALGNPSAAWSLDARLRRPPASIPYWPVFLIKFQVATVYGFAALSKINGSFLGGELLGSRWQGAVDRIEPLERLLAFDPVLVAISVSAVMVEGFLAVGLWSERYRRVALPLGLGFHIAIPLTLGIGLIPFSTLILSAYVLFPQWGPGSRRVVWDERSHGISDFVAVFRRLDWFGVHDYGASTDAGMPPRMGITRGPPRTDRVAEAEDRREGPEAIDRAIQLSAPGERSEGYDAVRMMLEKSPVTFLFAPLLGAWPLAPLGRRAYRRLARRGRFAIEPARP